MYLSFYHSLICSVPFSSIRLWLDKIYTMVKKNYLKSCRQETGKNKVTKRHHDKSFIVGYYQRRIEIILYWEYFLVKMYTFWKLLHEFNWDDEFEVETFLSRLSLYSFYRHFRTCKYEASRDKKKLQLINCVGKRVILSIVQSCSQKVTWWLGKLKNWLEMQIDYVTW